MASKVRLRNFGFGVRLTQDGSDNDGPVWIQVAREGNWKGSAKYGTVEFSRQTLEKLVKNLHAHPSFEKGPDGLGCKTVVPYDYEHASEVALAAPNHGSTPTSGAPAPAWVLDLQVREGDEGAELWALSKLGSQVRTQIREGGYQWTSVAVWPNALDPVTGERVGPVLTSVAFTNHPFIQGMAPIAASVSIYGKAESAEEVIVGVRDLLGLDADAPRELVMTELQDLRAAVADGRTGPGYPDGFGFLVDGVRRLLGLRVLATTDEIINSAGQMIAALSDPSSQAAPPAQETPPMAEPQTTLTAKLADLLNCRDTEPVLLAAVAKEKVKGDSLDQLMDLFGSSDTQALFADAKKAIEKAKKAEELLGALTAANERLAVTDKVEAEAEVEQIAASMGATEANGAKLKKLLLNERMACVGDPAKLAEFRTNYPLPDPTKIHLTRPIVAGPGSVQLGGALTAVPPQGGAGGGNPPAAPAHVQLFAAYPGRNDVEKAVAYHTDKTPGFRQQPRAVQCRMAGEFVRTGALPAS